MANEVMGTLFGVTPEALMAQREAQLQQRALQFAQLDPMQAAQAGFFTAGNRAGTAIGGLLGAEDPELMRIRQRQNLMQGIDLNNPKSLREAALAARQSGDAPAALQLAQRAMDVELAQSKLSSEQALISQRNAQAARERQQSVPTDIQVAQRLSALESAIPQYEAAGDETTVRQLKKERDELIRLTTKEGQRISFGADRESIAAELYNKPFASLTQTEKAEVNRREAALGKGKTTVVLPGEGTAKVSDLTSFETRVTTNLKPFKEDYDIASTALTLINTDNPKAGAQVDRALARASGDSQLSQAEVTAVASAGSFPQRVVDSVSKFFTGGAGALSKEQKEDVLRVFQKAAADRYNTERSRLNDLYSTSQLSKTQVEAGLGKPLEVKMPTNVPAGGGVGPFTDAAKEARYQQWKRSQQANRP